MDMKYTLYVLICAVTAFLSVSCNVKKEVLTPEEVVEQFCRSVAAGDFDTARALCDTASMKDYLENYHKTMASLQKEDSCALAIASSILSSAEFEVSDIKKDGEDRIIRYRIEAEGSEKTRTATVTKKEGEWRVTRITDAI